MKRKVIAWKNMPPSWQRVAWCFALVWLYLDRYAAPQWLIGALALLFGLLFAASIAAAIQSESVDIFEERRK